MVQHPYWPTDLVLPDYVPPVKPFHEVLSWFFGVCGVFFAVTWFITGRYKHLKLGERMVASWFAMSGVVHFCIEGWFVLHPDYLKDTTGGVLPEICVHRPRPMPCTNLMNYSRHNALAPVPCHGVEIQTLGTGKEYTNADSRYATRDAFVVAMEAVTAFVEGPGCYAAVYGMLLQRPWVSTAQILVSAGQLYGTVLYFFTSLLEGCKDTRPEWRYFWFYFVFVNFIWIVVPTIVIARAASRVQQAISAVTSTATGRKTI